MRKKRGTRPCPEARPYQPDPRNRKVGLTGNMKGKKVTKQNVDKEKQTNISVKLWLCMQN